MKEVINLLLGINSQKIFHIWGGGGGGGWYFLPLPVSLVVNLALPQIAFAQIGTSYYVIKSKFENHVYTGIQWRF